MSRCRRTKLLKSLTSGWRYILTILMLTAILLLSTTLTAYLVKPKEPNPYQTP